METISDIANIATAVISVASIIAAVTPTSKDDAWITNPYCFALPMLIAIMSMKRYSLAIHTSSLGVGVTAAMIDATEITAVAMLAMSEIVSITNACLLYTSPSPRDGLLSRMPSSA